jgi:hypothetical protein
MSDWQQTLSPSTFRIEVSYILHMYATLTSRDY